MRLLCSRSFNSGTHTTPNTHTHTDGIAFFFTGLIMEDKGMEETVFFLWLSAKIKYEHVGFSFSGGLGGTKQYNDIINNCLLRYKCVSAIVCVIVATIYFCEPLVRCMNGGHGPLLTHISSLHMLSHVSVIPPAFEVKRETWFCTRIPCNLIMNSATDMHSSSGVPKI